MDQEITKEELEQLELLAFQDPILKKEYDKHRLAILGIKMNALREVRGSPSDRSRYPDRA